MINKEDSKYYKSKHIIESKPEGGMDSVGKDYAVPEAHKERYKDENTKKRLSECYEQIKEVIGYYLDVADEKKTIMALWVLGTYLHDQFETFPYLFLNAMRGSGKSRTLKLLTTLSHEGEVLLSPTEASLFRTNGTLGIDEFEGLASKEKATLRELLNAGYKKGFKIVRMKKKKSSEGESIEPEYFEPYRPIIMANISGIEEVLSDRSISIILEKSSVQGITKLIEDFATNDVICGIKDDLEAIRCSLCSVVTEKKHKEWNDYVKIKYTLPTPTTYTTYTTLTTLTTTPLDDKTREMFDKIDNTNLDGRNLELHFPLFLISRAISESVFNSILDISKSFAINKRIDDMTESKDVSLYNFVSRQDSGQYFKIKNLTTEFIFILGEGESNKDWLNTKWMGRALKRLNLIVNKRRVSDGVEVILDVKKALKKMEMFE